MIGKGDRRKTGLVLSGGGADSAYSVGVLKALCSGQSPLTRGKPLDPEVITGTSAGAYNAAFLVSEAEKSGFRAAVARLEEVWLDQLASSPTSCGNGVFRLRGYPPEYFNPFCLMTQPFQQASELVRDTGFLAVDSLLRSAKAASMEGPLISRVINVASVEPFISADPLEKTIHQTIDFSLIPQAGRALKVATTNWSRGMLRIFGNSELTGEMGCAALMASAALPGLFQPVEIESCLYVDGGLLLNTPLKPAIRAGADDLYVVFFDPDVAAIPIDVLSSTIDAFYRSLVIVWASKINRDVVSAQIVNRSIRRLRQIFAASRDSGQVQLFVRNMHGRREALDYRLLNIHLIHPKDNLGGTLGFLNFDKGRIEGLIQRGYQDALGHDCGAEQCVFADKDTEILN